MNSTKVFFLLFLSIIVSSCKEKNIEYPNLPKEGKYLTDYILVSPAIDLNRDGVKSDNIFDETTPPNSSLNYSLSISNREDLGRRILNFSFPYLYADPNDPNFKSLGGKAIFSDFRLEVNELVTDNPAILSAILLNDSTIEVTSVAEFELIEGKKEVEMKAIYHWNSL